jgi:hypothetical protein
MRITVITADDNGETHFVDRELEVQVSDGEVRRLSAGAVVYLEDTEGKGHTTRVVGDEAVSGVFVQLPRA